MKKEFTDSGEIVGVTARGLADIASHVMVHLLRPKHEAPNDCIIRLDLNAAHGYARWQCKGPGEEIPYIGAYPVIVEAPDANVRTRIYYRPLDGGELRRWEYVDGRETDGPAPPKFHWHMDA